MPDFPFVTFGKDLAILLFVVVVPAAAILAIRTSTYHSYDKEKRVVVSFSCFWMRKEFGLKVKVSEMNNSSQNGWVGWEGRIPGFR